jgi:threonine dehydrogenase-like Zn-dependent dehydrogenase
LFEHRPAIPNHPTSCRRFKTFEDIQFHLRTPSMLGVTFPGEREVALLNFPDPTPGTGEVVLEMKASGMCGSDLRAYRAPKDMEAFREAYKGLPTITMRDNGPLIMGHEPCGVVAAIGPSVSAFQARVGQRVMVHHYDACDVCDQCRTGWTWMCDNVVPKNFGQTAHGGHAQYMKVPAKTLIPLPDELSFEAGAAISCGSGTSYSALRRMRVNGTVAIFGQGPVGLSGTQFAVAMGCRVIALDPSEERRNLAKKFGADVVLDPKAIDSREAIRELTGGFGADFALETSGTGSGATDSVRSLRKWGTVAFVGMTSTATFNLATDVILRQVNMLGSLTFSTAIMHECALFSVQKNVPVDAIFSDRWRLDQADEAYKLLDKQSSGKGVFMM